MSGAYPTKVIEIFGGAGRGAVARMARLTGLNQWTIYGWRRLGIIPATQHKRLFAAARAHGLDLRPEHFFDLDDDKSSEEAA